MEKIIWIWLMFLAMPVFGQGCPEYASLVREGDVFAASKQYRKALNKYNAARLCTPAKSAEVDRKIAGLFDAIEREKDDAVIQRNEANKAKELSETNIRKLSDLVGIVTNVIQDDKYSGLLGFTPLRTELLNALIPANQFISANSKNETVPWRSAEVHLQLGAAYEDVGKGVDSEEELYQAYSESRKIIEETLSKKKKVPDDLVYVYLRSVMFYSWNLLSLNNLGEAKKVIDFTDDLVTKLKSNSPKYFYGVAGIANVQSRLHQLLGNDSLSLSKTVDAVTFTRRALAKEPDNLRYRKSLIVYLNNQSIVKELSKADKEQLSNEACDLAYSIDSIPGNGSLVTSNVVECVLDRSFDKNASIDLKGERLLKMIQKVSSLKFLDPHSPGYDRHLARLHLRLSYMYADTKYGLDLTETQQAVYRKEAAKHFKVGFEYWLKYYKSKTTINDLWIARNSYSDIITLIQLLEIPADESYNLLIKLVDAFEDNAKTYGNVLDVAEITARAYGKLSEFTLVSKKDTSLTLKYLDRATAYVEVVLKEQKFTEYKEYYADFGKTFSDRISIFLIQGNTTQAMAAYRKLFDVYYPVYEKYEFDFYLGQHFLGSSFRMGEHLFKKGMVKEAIPILGYASYRGIGESTKILSQIYKEGLMVPKDQQKADSLEALAPFQTIKKFTIPCDFGGKKAPFDVYVMHRAKDYRYKGIEDQAEWLTKARGGTIPKEVRESFIKLQDLAWKNNVSFPDLCVQALEAANAEKGKASKSSEKSDTDIMGKNAKTTKNTAEALADKKTPLQKKMDDLKASLQTSDTVRARAISGEILAMNGGIETRYGIYSLYLNADEPVDVQTLFLKDPAEIKNNRAYFMTQKPEELRSDQLRRMFYYHLTLFDESCLKAVPGDSTVIKKQMSQHYNSLAWYCIKSKRLENVHVWLDKSRSADKENIYPYSNIPHAYLFAGQTEKAKDLYLKVVDIPFNSSFPTFRDAFLADFKEFEQEGLGSPAMTEIKDLLTKKNK